MADLYAITNPGFEEGSTGWTLPAGASVVNYNSETGEPVPEGVNALKFTTTSGLLELTNTPVPVGPGKSITLSAMYQQGAANSGRNGGYVVLLWLDAAGGKVSESVGNTINSGSSGKWGRSAVTATRPDGATQVVASFRVNRDSTAASYVDAFQWNHTFTGDVLLTYPQNGQTYAERTSVPFRVQITTPATNAATKVTYYSGSDVVGESTTAPFAVNFDGLTVGTHDITALVLFADGTELTTNSNLITVTADPIPPLPRREYKASNSMTTLVAGDFQGLASSIPSISLITGVEVELDFNLLVSTRNKDLEVPADQSMPDAVFSMISNGTVELVLLREEGGQHSRVGSPVTAPVDITRGSFTQEESGMSDGMRWAAYYNDSSYELTAGSEDDVFGLESMAAAEFLNLKVGLRFYPNLGTVIPTTEMGDAAVRLLLNAMKVRVYFNSGSVKYYFLTPEGDEVSGILVSSYVLSGSLASGDGSGVMQIKQDLRYTGDDEEPYDITTAEPIRLSEGTTIHSATPASDDNMIGVLTQDMEYNRLPNSYELDLERTRSSIITANFYGDERMNSMYGVNGRDRAFSYDGDNFYRIYTQPEAEKDKPRHVAFHHSHLALGYKEGRVDISVAGEPYNFDGVDGASSWGIGDSVTGLLPLSGSILGIFCSGSVVGMSGTTVDNFATQTISAKMGAVEYTIADMGFPVYANTYGVYTLSQVQQYGDYLGTPLSQDISPWLKDRLMRKSTSDVDVVAAWPVRSKNQYRLAFADGYVMTMTMNFGQQSAPTFSLQRYLLPYEEDNEDSVYSGPALIPAAISSELDEGGEERIHIAHAQVLIHGGDDPDPDPEPTECATIEGYDAWGSGGGGRIFYVNYIDVPEWVLEEGTLYIDFYDNGDRVQYDMNVDGNFELVDRDNYIDGEGRGVIYSYDMSLSVCLDWYVPPGV